MVWIDLKGPFWKFLHEKIERKEYPFLFFQFIYF